MADLKISALPASTVPLGGTEVLPIVQGSATKQVTVANLTAGRAISALSGTFNAGTFAAFPAVTIGASSETSRNYQMGMITGAKWALYENIGPTKLIDVDATGNTSFYGGNLIQGTAAKGINFTANTPAAGMTSQLLNWYETGTWTPTLAYSVSNGDLAYNAGFRNGYYTKVGTLVTVVMYVLFSETTASGNLTITNLPFATASLTNTLVGGGMYVDGMTLLVGAPVWQINQNGGTVMSFFYTGTGSASNISNTNTSATNNVIRLTASYYSA